MGPVRAVLLPSDSLVTPLLEQISSKATEIRRRAVPFVGQERIGFLEERPFNSWRQFSGLHFAQVLCGCCFDRATNSK